MQDEGESFRVLGLDIKFPYRGYGVQKSMMNHITRTLMNKQNSLIESPTGTGKTLVLLCSSMAWLQRSRSIGKPYISDRLTKEFNEQRRAALASKECFCGRRQNQQSANLLDVIEDMKMKKQKSKPTMNKEEIVIDLTEDDEEKPLCKSCLALQTEEKFSDVLTDEGREEIDGFVPNKILSKIPRIYYGTRTHKQISQVIRELNKSAYKRDLKMCILSSRERTCINSDVKDFPDRNDRCRELLKNRSNGGPNEKRKDEGESCRFNKDSNTIGQLFELINTEFTDQAWDIEDANKFGIEHQACPYYGCRSLQEGADITFCPYNYLLDPQIRKTLNINLKNAIIIFDEAHNIEDICRESASFIIDTEQINEILDAINIGASHYAQGSAISDAYHFFKDKFLNLKALLLNYNFGPSGEQKRILSHTEMLKQLEEIGLGPDSLEKIKSNLSEFAREDKDAPDNSKSQDDNNDSSLSMNSLRIISALSVTLEFMYANSCKNIGDFRGVVTRSVPMKNFQKPNPNKPAISSGPNYVTRIELLCMNSAISFEKIHSQAWSVIVASGTLSPIESMQTELGCSFTTPFQGGHVIPQDRVLATVLTHGPTRHELNCSFTNSISLQFQDEVGAVVRDVCRTIPNGVLCFFPSYDRLDGLYQRWFTKGYIAEIQKSGKKIYREKKNVSANEFELELGKYNTNAKRSGALLLAVYRGKVSEGIDFADSAARAVITIGIPYPNVKEITVGLKRDYNDVARRDRPHLLPGRDWYASQAFRALNQAVGRCIRHREDWGAIIMIDSRLKVGDTVDSKVSKWLRPLIFSNPDYDIVLDHLKEFAAILSNKRT